jgi:PilZ domain
LQVENGAMLHAVGNQSSFITPEIDRRAHDRYLAIFRVAKLTSGNEESLCVARNLSSGGMMIDVLVQHEVGQNVRVSLAEDQHLEGHIIWQRDFKIGIRFESDIDVMEVLAKSPVLPNGYMRRMPRMPVREPAQLRIGSNALPIEICDISPRGARLKADHNIDERQMMWVVLKGLEPICCNLRWRMDGFIGVEFFSVNPIIQLMNWLREAALSSVAEA